MSNPPLGEAVPLHDKKDSFPRQEGGIDVGNVSATLKKTGPF